MCVCIHTRDPRVAAANAHSHAHTHGYVAPMGANPLMSAELAPDSDVWTCVPAPTGCYW